MSLGRFHASAMEKGQDLSSFSKEWHLDLATRFVENGNGSPTYLSAYMPKSSTPFISFSTPNDVQEIWTYDCKYPTKIPQKQCSICDDKMKYADILYELNEDCGHGIFCFVYYCKEDGIFIPDRYYTQCGCK